MGGEGGVGGILRRDVLRPSWKCESELWRRGLGLGRLLASLPLCWIVNKEIKGTSVPIIWCPLRSVSMIVTPINS